MARFLNNDTITGSLTSNLLCLPNDVVTYKGVTNASTSLTSFVESLISAVSTKSETFVGHPLVAQQFYGYYDGNDSNTLRIRNRPLISVESIDHRDSITSAWQSVGLNNVYIYNNRIVLSDSCFEKGYQNYRINYTSGYSTIPDIKQFVIEKVVVKISESNFGSDNTNISKDLLGVTNVTNQSVASLTQTMSDLTDREKDVLMDYKLRVKEIIVSS